jgi:hypothetical protein
MPDKDRIRLNQKKNLQFYAGLLVNNLLFLLTHIFTLLLLLLSLAPQPSLGLGFLLKIRLNFLEASQQFSFLQGRVVSPTPNPHPGGPDLCIYIPQRQGGYPF